MMKNAKDMNANAAMTAMLKGLQILSLFALPAIAHAQNWPAKPVKVIVPTGPGLASDLIGRVLVDKLSRQVNQQFYVENVAGAATILGAQAAARAAPDGYTLIMATAGTVVNNPLIIKSLPYNPERDFVPISFVGDNSFFVFAVTNDLPVKTLADLIRLEKSKPGGLSLANDVSAGVSAMVGRYLNKQAGIEIVEVGYKSAAQAIQDTIAGRTQIFVGTLASVDTFLRAGKLRAIAATAESKTPNNPGIPLVSETLPGFALTGFLILMAPTGTPAPILQRMNQEVQVVLKDPEMVKRLEAFGFATTKLGSLQATQEALNVERGRWAKVVRELGISPQ